MRGRQLQGNLPKSVRARDTRHAQWAADSCNAVHRSHRGHNVRQRNASSKHGEGICLTQCNEASRRDPKTMRQADNTGEGQVAMQASIIASSRPKAQQVRSINQGTKVKELTKLSAMGTRSRVPTTLRPAAHTGWERGGKAGGSGGAIRCNSSAGLARCSLRRSLAPAEAWIAATSQATAARWASCHLRRAE